MALSEPCAKAKTVCKVSGSSSHDVYFVDGAIQQKAVDFISMQPYKVPAFFFGVVGRTTEKKSSVRHDTMGGRGAVAHLVQPLFCLH